MSVKRNIDAVLGAVGQGHDEAESRPSKAPKSTTPKPRKRETVAATFNFETQFLAQIRRLGLDWRDEAIPASSCREGAVIQALAQAALDDPKSLKRAMGLAKNRKA